ncbi:MAG: hypothetical protein IPI61_07755 [Syntrophaceae bacterium]|nr:hypothetical protein [Syntrophaceae bacterium]
MSRRTKLRASQGRTPKSTNSFSPAGMAAKTIPFGLRVYFMRSSEWGKKTFFGASFVLAKEMSGSIPGSSILNRTLSSSFTGA